MKKFLVLAVIVLSLAMAQTCFAAQALYRVGSGVLRSGPCRVLSAQMYAVTAADTCMIYDANSAAGCWDARRKFELATSVNTSNSPAWDANLADFQNGVYVFCSAATIQVTVIVDY